MPSGVFPQAVLDTLGRGGDRPVFEHGERIVSAAQMSGLIRRVAAGLRRAGVKPGAGVAMMPMVSAEAFAALIAAHALGARVVGVRPGLTPAQLDALLARDIMLTVSGGRSLDELAGFPDDGEPLVAEGHPEDVARLIVTSGSTGAPKGCAQTYGAMTAAWASHPDRWPPAVRALAGRLRRYLVFGTLSSQVMLEYGLLTLAAGGTMVVADPPGFPGAIVRHRATASVITVAKLFDLVRRQRSDPADLSTLRALMVSGSPLVPGRLREVLDVLGPVVFHGYGQTETGMISMLTPDEMLADPSTLSTVGRAPDVTSLRVQDGELWVRTPAQASGYWDDPAGSAEVFTGGWVRTRDLARVDERGYVHLLGRLRDVVIVNANLVPAGPIERVLATDPAVAEAYVVGAPDEATGEAIHAFLVASPPVDPEALRRLVEDRLGPASVPASFTLIDAAPIAPSGKPDKAALRERVAKIGLSNPT
jgi:fatty-acyl-CoA synthase